MAILEIRKYPDKVLKEKAKPVAQVDDEVRKLMDDMVETMYAAPGVGLAAPQVGVSKRVIVVDVGSLEDEKNSLFALANPVILDAEGSEAAEEGCLSLPDFTAEIKRAEKVVVKALLRSGEEMTFSAEGMLARALQHEIDHLEGTLILDRANLLSREFYKKRLKKKTVKAG